MYLEKIVITRIISFIFSDAPYYVSCISINQDVSVWVNVTFICAMYSKDST